MIYNPHAGHLRNATGKRLDRAREDLKHVASDVQFIATCGPRTAGQLALDAIAAGADLIIAAGGDGTINEVINGLANSPVPLGILPAGTANVLASEVGLKRNLAAAAKQMAGCMPERVPLGMVQFPSGEKRHFLLMAGVGFDAEIIYHLSANWKEKLGKFSYFLGGIRRIGKRLSEFEVRIDGVARPCTFALISKVRNYGGDFEIASEVRLHDEAFEVILFEGTNSWRYLLYLVGVATRHLAHTPGVCFSRATTMELSARTEKGVYLQVDGELLGKLPARISMGSDYITLLLPKYPARSQASKEGRKDL